jgi:hypothetical protein
MPLYVFVIEDGNGMSNVVAFALLASEDANTFNWMLSTLRADQPNTFDSIQACMADKARHLSGRSAAKR